MPRRALRPCAHPGCPVLVVKGCCSTHERARQERADTKTDEERRFYGSARWKRFRAWFLTRHPLCEECLKEGRTTQATVADHRTRRRDGGADFDEANTQALCGPCHQRKRGQERQESAASRGV